MRRKGNQGLKDLEAKVEGKNLGIVSWNKVGLKLNRGTNKLRNPLSVLECDFFFLIESTWALQFD